MRWESAKIIDCIDKIQFCKPSQDFGNGNFCYIDISSVDNKIKMITSVQTIRGLDAPSRAKQMVQEGDVIVSTVRPNLNAVAYIEKHHHGAVASTGFCVLRSDKDKIHPRYLYFWVRSNMFISNMVKQATGASYPAVSDTVIKQSLISLPPLYEQERIAEILDKADSLRQKDKSLLQKYHQLAQCIFYDMFGDPVKNEKGWEVKKLLECVEGKYGIKAGPFGSSLKKEFYVSSGYKIYGQEQVIADDFSIGDYYISDPKYKELESCKVTPGDVLISMVGTYGKVSVVPENVIPGIINPRLVKISFDKTKINPLYFKFCFQLPETKYLLSTYSRGGTMDIINAGILKTLDILSPPISMQNIFVKKLERISDSKNLISTNTSKMLFDALMSKYFE